MCKLHVGLPRRGFWRAWAVGAIAVCIGMADLPGRAAAAEAQPGPALAEQVLEAGAVAQGQLDAMQASAHRFAAAEGDYVSGRLDGVRMRLVLVDAEGRRERVLATGSGESQGFVFVVGSKPPYALEVRAPEGGGYTLRLDEMVARTRQVAPAAVIESSRLRALQRTLEAGGGSDAFWDEVKRSGAPLVEPLPRDAGAGARADADADPSPAGADVLVTFVWRGARHGVRLFGAPSGDHDELQRLGTSDVWFRSYRVPATTRLGYRLAPDVPELDAPAGVRRRAILATAQRDPFNARSFPARPVDIYAGESVLELPDAPPQPWLEARPGVAPGTVERHRFESAGLGNLRDVYLYRPAGWRAGAAGNGLVVLFDAETYADRTMIPTPVILDNLIAQGVIGPTAAILIGNPTRATRSAELPPNPAFARFLATELMPWARERGVRASAARTVVTGSSYGGLAAAYAGLQHPEWFGRVYSQSGSFWWQPPKASAAGDREPEWLTREYAARPRQPLAFYLEAGLFEGSRGRQVGILESTRHLRDVLRAKGYAVQHVEHASGHDYLHWRGTLATGIAALLGPPGKVGAR